MGEDRSCASDPYVICPACKRPAWIEKDKLVEHLKAKHNVEEVPKPKASGFLSSLFR